MRTPLSQAGISLIFFALTACSSFSDFTFYPEASHKPIYDFPPADDARYAKRLPQYIDTGGEKTILVDPNRHVWGAYGADGNLIRAGLASGGADWCHDIHRPCHTRPGTFRINFLGDETCISSLYPIPDGGAPMPFCMFFNGNQALHGSPHVVEGNISHGCVRVRTSDAAWLRYHFVEMGTKIIIKPY